MTRTSPAAWALVILVALWLPGRALAEKAPYEDWLSSLPGTWHFEIGDGVKGTIDWKPVFGGKAIMGTGSDSNGANTIWTWLWSESDKKLLLTWFSADSGQDYGVVRFDVTKGRLVGKYEGMIGGEHSTALVTVTKAKKSMRFDWSNVQVGDRTMGDVRRVLMRN